MRTWLTEQAPSDGFAFHGDLLPGLDTMAIYLRDPALAAELVEVFERELANWTMPGAN